MHLSKRCSLSLYVSVSSCTYAPTGVCVCLDMRVFVSICLYEFIAQRLFWFCRWTFAELWSKTCFWLTISLIIHNNMCYCYCFVFIFLASLLHFFASALALVFVNFLFFSYARCYCCCCCLADRFCVRVAITLFYVAIRFYLSEQFHQISLCAFLYFFCFFFFFLLNQEYSRWIFACFTIMCAFALFIPFIFGLKYSDDCWLRLIIYASAFDLCARILLCWRSSSRLLVRFNFFYPFSSVGFYSFVLIPSWDSFYHDILSLSSMKSLAYFCCFDLSRAFVYSDWYLLLAVLDRFGYFSFF